MILPIAVYYIRCSIAAVYITVMRIDYPVVP